MGTQDLIKKERIGRCILLQIPSILFVWDKINCQIHNLVELGKKSLEYVYQILANIFIFQGENYIKVPVGGWFYIPGGSSLGILALTSAKSQIATEA